MIYVRDVNSSSPHVFSILKLLNLTPIKPRSDLHETYTRLEVEIQSISRIVDSPGGAGSRSLEAVDSA